MSLRAKWQEVDLDDVMRYFADGFKFESGKILRYEYTIDTFKRKVVFKLFVEEKGE